MNKEWELFLSDRPDVIGFSTSIDLILPIVGDGGENTICPIFGFEILSVSGKDAETFLQGQSTCDISKIDETSFSLGAFCDPKGRVLATFWVSRRDDNYWLVIAADLVDKIQKRLQMYVLRSDVILQPVVDWVLLGVSGHQVPEVFAEMGLLAPDSAGRASHNIKTTVLYLEGQPDRFLMMANLDQAKAMWDILCDQYSFKQGEPSYWPLWEMNNGIVQITSSFSGEFTPQMLNMDLTGGVSFEKGCYTGQEVIARTHYLGKPKRRMFLAECSGKTKLDSSVKIVSVDEDVSVGVVLSTVSTTHSSYLQAVLKTGEFQENLPNLHLASGESINLLNLPYTLD
ncbi:MAG: hypothetical protein V3V31_00200 [Methylococcales bacterium]